MTQKLYNLYLECAELCNKQTKLINKAIDLFEKEFGNEPFIDSDFLAGLHYGEIITKKELERSIREEAILYET